MIMPDDDVVVFDQILKVAFLAGDVQHHSDGVGVLGCHVLSLIQQIWCCEAKITQDFFF